MPEHADKLDALFAELLRTAGKWPQARIGLYLHGSRARGQERPDSDVDVLALADPSTPEQTLDEFVATGEACTAPMVERLDLKAMSTGDFAANPWVKLHRARFVGGHDWRSELPQPSFDQHAREALAVFRVIFQEDDLSWTDQAGVQKILAWMATIVAGHTTGTPPASGTEARTMLRENEDPLGRDIEALLQDLESHPDATDLTDYRRRAHDLKDRVAALLLEQLHDGQLGPRCAEIVSSLAPGTLRT